MSNVTELRPRAAKGDDAPHIPTASPKPTTTKVPNAVQTAMSDEQVGKRQPPEPTSETLALGGGAQTIAVGKGNLRNLQRGDVLEVVVHATVVEAGGVRDKLDTKSGAVKDSVAKVVANIDRFDEVRVIGHADVDTVADDHPADAKPEDVDGERQPCHRCDGKGSFHAPGEEPDVCGLCGGVGSIAQGDDEEVVDEPKELPAGDAPAVEPEETMFDAPPATEEEAPAAPAALVVGDRSTYTEANLRAKSVRKPDLLDVWKDLTGRDLPASITKAKVLDAIVQVLLASQGEAAIDEASATAGDIDPNGDVAGEREPVTEEGDGYDPLGGDGTAFDAPREQAPAQEEPTAPADEQPAVESEEQPPAEEPTAAAEPDQYVTGKVVDIADDGSDVFAQVDAEGARVFVHDRSGQVFNALEDAVKFDPNAPVDVEGSDAAPAPEVEGQGQVEGDVEVLTFDEACMLTPTDLAQRSDAQLVDVSVALGVDRKQAESLNRVALLAVIEREQVPF